MKGLYVGNFVYAFPNITVKKLCYLLTLLILDSCVNYGYEEVGNSADLLQYKFEQYDSLTVDYLAGLFVVSDRSVSGLFLGLDFMDKTVVLFNHFGEITNRFNRVGGDPRAFGNYLFALGFYNDSTISVLSEKGIFFYSLKGELINKLTYSGDFTGFQMNSQLQLLPVTVNDSSYLLTLTDFGTDLKITVPEFYNEARYFTMINTKSNERRLTIKIEDDDLYRNGKFFFPDRFIPVFDVDREHNELKVKFPLGDKLYTYSLADEMALVKITNLEPEHLMEPVGVPFDKPESYIGFSTNGSYSHIYIKQDTTLLFYKTHFDTDKFTNDTGFNFFDDPAGYYTEYRHLYTSKYCQVFVKDKKLCEDILLPAEASYIAWVDNFNYIVMGKETNWQSKEADNEKFYIYKIAPASVK